MSAVHPDRTQVLQTSSDAVLRKGREDAMELLELHPKVAELARLVGRMFYRDEHVVLIDLLTYPHGNDASGSGGSLPFLREDQLSAVMGLPQKQTKAILEDLVRDGIVAVEIGVIEKASTEERRAARIRAAAAAQAGETPVTKLSADEARRRAGRLTLGEAQAAAARDKELARREGSARPSKSGISLDDADAASANQEKTNCYYIDPLALVENTRLRLALMSKVIAGLERNQSKREQLQCDTPGCRSRYTLLQALRGRQSAAGAAGAGTGSSSGGVPVGQRQQLTCHKCGAPLRDIDGEESRTAGAMAAMMSDRWQLQQQPLQRVLAKLQRVKLPRRKPSYFIRYGVVSLRAARAQDAAGGAGGGASSGAGGGYGGGGTLAGGVYSRTASSRVQVVMEEGGGKEGGSGGGADGGAGLFVLDEDGDGMDGIGGGMGLGMGGGGGGGDDWGAAEDAAMSLGGGGMRAAKRSRVEPATGAGVAGGRAGNGAGSGAAGLSHLTRSSITGKDTHVMGMLSAQDSGAVLGKGANDYSGNNYYAVAAVWNDLKGMLGGDSDSDDSDDDGDESTSGSGAGQGASGKAGTGGHPLHGDASSGAADGEADMQGPAEKLGGGGNGEAGQGEAGEAEEDSWSDAESAE